MARITFMRRFSSDLDLTGGAPVRARPSIGEWGPDQVPTTAQKKRLRIWVSIALVAATTAIGVLMYVFYKLLGY
ncbi:hypothetical protein EFN01_00805 [Propionibacterium freudenreichii]|nr:hypothetical protein [Propionibacterium freudenreichii]